MARYLVTGCAGFIGWKVCQFLLADNHFVVGVDNLNDAYDVRLKYWRLAQLEGRPGFRFQRMDITDREALHQLWGSFHHDALDGPRSNAPPFHAVINLAARAGVRQSCENPWLYFETNTTGTLNLLALCQEFGVHKFVLASTSSLYGSCNSRPFREDANTDSPLCPYAASKKAAEAVCHTYHNLYDIDVTVLRYFTVYGPAGRPDMSLFRFVQWISEGRPLIVYGDGTQERDFTFVDDVARGTLVALRPLGCEVVNLGSDQPIVLSEAIRLIEAFVGKKAAIEYKPHHPADIRATWADIGKAGRLLGWRPRVAFEEGVARLVDWYQTNRSWARDLSTLPGPCHPKNFSSRS